MKRFSLNTRSGSKGQSFVELSLVVLLLMELLAGIAEFGVLLNRYLNMVDGAREAARYGANYDPFVLSCTDAAGNPVALDSDGICPFYYQSSAQQAEQVIQPIVLDPLVSDDIVISILVIRDTVTCRYPTYENGWSYREHVDLFASDNQESSQSTTDIEGKMNIAGAPPVSLILVEIYYHYPQTLKAPFYEQFFPDPVPVYTYSIMPLKNVNPLTGPCYVP